MIIYQCDMFDPSVIAAALWLHSGATAAGQINTTQYNYSVCAKWTCSRNTSCIFLHLLLQDSLWCRDTRIHPHFWQARSSPYTALTHWKHTWKYANHNNIAIEPQLILCYEDFKDRHLPDIHNKGVNRKEKCKDSNEPNKIKTWLGENLDTFCTVC